jgi:hypothetical protein
MDLNENDYLVRINVLVVYAPQFISNRLYSTMLDDRTTAPVSAALATFWCRSYAVR